MEKYKKLGTAGYRGIKFQVQLTTVLLLNALKNYSSFKLSSENTEAGKFDDIVLECKSSTFLLQSKHRETRQVTSEELFSPNTRNNKDFNLVKYFLSYLDVKSKFPVSKVIICTNTGVRLKEDHRELLRSHTVGPDSILYCEGHDCRFYTFEEAVVPLLKESITSTETFTDDDLKDFLEHLQFYSNYPNGERLDKVIEQLLLSMKFSDSILCKISSQDILNKVIHWFEQTRGEYLSETRARRMFCEIRSDKYYEILDHYGVLLTDNEFPFEDTRSIFHVVVDRQYLLQVIRIFRALQVSKKKALYVNSDDDVDMRKRMIDAFELPRYRFLVIIWPEIVSKTDAREITITLRGILERYNYKKIMLVGERANRLIREIESDGRDIVTYDESVTFGDLTEDTRDRILNKELIVFQGNLTSLKELLGAQTTEFYGRAVNSKVLEKLVKGEEIKVGSVVRRLDEDIACYYIPRKFAREIEDEEFEEETYSEENICEVSDKFVTIENRGGMGKSTVLTNLAAMIKQKHPHLWVIRIEFNKYKDIFKEFRKRNKDTISVMELLDSHDATKLQTELEKLVFSLDNKAVLILDAVDEISDDVNPYLELILSLFKQCQDASNIAKVFIASREHAIQALVEELRVTPFRLLPFVEQDYVDFFTKFWTYKLSLTDRDKLQTYSETLVSKMGLWINPDFTPGQRLVVIPLHLKMLAQVFQESDRFEASENWDGVREFLNCDKSRPKLPRKVNIAKLFKMLIEKKEDGLIDEMNLRDLGADNQMTIKKYNECLAYRKML